MTGSAVKKARQKPAARLSRAVAAAPPLAELQDRFQKAVMDGDETIFGLIPDNSRTTRDVLLGVYRHAYTGRLVDVVASDYEALKSHMGDASFDAMARTYIKENPSRTPNARWFSHKLPEFLAVHPRFAKREELAELARLERALADAFDAPDVSAADLESLRTVPHEKWAALQFVPHASVRRLDQATNAFDIWVAVKDGLAPPPAAVLPDGQRLIVWREQTTSKVRVLGGEEAMLWDEAAKGVPFGPLCELAAVYDDPDSAALRAAQCLQGWLTTGMLARAEVGNGQ